MRLIRKAHLAPGHHECAYMSYKPSERDGTWIELLLADPAKVRLLLYVQVVVESLRFAHAVEQPREMCSASCSNQQHCAQLLHEAQLRAGALMLQCAGCRFLGKRLCCWSESRVMLEVRTTAVACTYKLVTLYIQQYFQMNADFGVWHGSAVE